MNQLVKRCYIHGILIVHVIETKSICICYFQRVLSDNIFNECYAVSYLHIMQLAIEKMLSLSEMYHDTFNKSKEIEFLMQTINKKSNRQIKHAYTIFVKFMHNFLA